MPLLCSAWVSSWLSRVTWCKSWIINEKRGHEFWKTERRGTWGEKRGGRNNVIIYYNLKKTEEMMFNRKPESPATVNAGPVVMPSGAHPHHFRETSRRSGTSQSNINLWLTQARVDWSQTGNNLEFWWHHQAQITMSDPVFTATGTWKTCFRLRFDCWEV